MSKTTFEDLVKCHGKPLRVSHGETRRTGARMSISMSPPVPKYVDHASWPCGLEARMTFGGHFQILKRCQNAGHVQDEVSE